MPYITDKTTLKNPFLDRRTKLLPCQREMVHYWYAVRGEGIRAIARRFKVDKRTIQFELFPDRLKKNIADREKRGGTKIYYDREKHNEAINDHRRYKYKTLKDLPE